MEDTSRAVAAQGLRTRTLGQQKDRLTHGFAVVGPSPTPGLRFTITGLGLGSASPSVVVLQPRQSDNVEKGWTDEFAVQVVETATDHVVGRVQRIDAGSDGRWSQQLRLDILIVEIQD